jgi:hypothetical protein
MKSSIDRIKLIFFGVFVVACAAAWGYQAMFIWPKQRCEAHGDWWDDEDRVCAVPMPIWAFTHRMPGEVALQTPPAKPGKAALASGR